MSTSTPFSELLHALDYPSGDEVIPDDLLPFIGFLISKAAQTIVERVDGHLSDYAITSRHYGVMLLLSRNAGLQQNTIGEKLRIDRTTMVKLVDELEAQGLVERHKDPNDRRAYALSLSAKGYGLLPEIGQRVIQTERSVLSRLDHDEIKQLFSILLKLLMPEADDEIE